MLTEFSDSWEVMCAEGDLNVDLGVSWVCIGIRKHSHNGQGNVFRTLWLYQMNVVFPFVDSFLTYFSFTDIYSFCCIAFC